MYLLPFIYLTWWLNLCACYVNEIFINIVFFLFGFGFFRLVNSSDYYCHCFCILMGSINFLSRYYNTIDNESPILAYSSHDDWILIQSVKIFFKQTFWSHSARLELHLQRLMRVSVFSSIASVETEFIFWFFATYVNGVLHSTTRCNLLPACRDDGKLNVNNISSRCYCWKF